jgi:pimeloyl-ACP methyl ester carboxylesterase
VRAQWIHMDQLGIVTPLDRVADAPEPRKPLILLIHGYNNDEFQAADSFFRMRVNVDELLAGAGFARAIREEFQRRIWEFYWPGYEPLTLINPQGLPRGGFENLLATSTYSLEVEKARTWVPDGLETYLTEASPSDVFFVAHSLGCRVAVETTKRLLNSMSTNVRVAGFLLMAGAIPIHLLHELADLGPTTRQVARRYCLYSHRDTVLMLAFPPGQIAANEIPVYGWPQAVGYWGLPKIWNVRSNTHLGHGAYWKRGLFASHQHLNDLFAGIFGVALERELPTLKLPVLQESPFISILPERNLSSGMLPGVHWLRDRYDPRSQRL